MVISLHIWLVSKSKMKNEESSSILDQLDIHMVYATLDFSLMLSCAMEQRGKNRPVPALSLCGVGSGCAVCLGSTKGLLYIPRMGFLISSESDNLRTFTSCFMAERG